MLVPCRVALTPINADVCTFRMAHILYQGEAHNPDLLTADLRADMNEVQCRQSVAPDGKKRCHRYEEADGSIYELPVLNLHQHNITNIARHYLFISTNQNDTLRTCCRALMQSCDSDDAFTAPDFVVLSIGSSIELHACGLLPEFYDARSTVSRTSDALSPISIAPESALTLFGRSRNGLVLPETSRSSYSGQRVTLLPIAPGVRICPL